MEGLLLMTTFFWGCSFLWCKDISDLNVDVNAYVAIRYALAVILLAPLCWKDLRGMTRRDALHGAVLGALYYGAQATQVWGLKYTTPANSSFITAAYVVLVPLTSWIILKKRPDKRFFLSIALCLVGLYILNLSPGEGLQFNLGNGITLLCAVIWSVQVTYLSYAGRETKTSLLAILPLGFAAAIAAVAALCTGGFALSGLPVGRFLRTVLLLVLFPTIASGLAQAHAQKYIEPTKAAVIYTTESVFACSLSVIFGYETLSFRLVLGGMLIIAAILLTEIRLPGKGKNSSKLEETKG